MSLEQWKAVVSWMQPVIWAVIAALGASAPMLAAGNDWKVSAGAAIAAFVMTLQIWNTKRQATSAIETKQTFTDVRQELQTNTSITDKAAKNAGIAAIAAGVAADKADAARTQSATTHEAVNGASDKRAAEAYERGLADGALREYQRASHESPPKPPGT